MTTKATDRTRTRRTRRVSTFYRDVRGVPHDAETHIIVKESSTRGAREVSAPTPKRPRRIAPVDAVEAADTATAAPPERVEIPDLAPPEPATVPAVEPSAAPATAAPVPAMEPSAAPVTAAPEPAPEKKPAGVPYVERVEPRGSATAESSPAATAAQFDVEAQRLGIAGPMPGAADDCPHCETETKVCPRCNREYAPIPREVAGIVGMALGKVSGSIVRGIAGKKYGVDPGPATLSEGELTMLTDAAHVVLRRRLPAKTGGAISDFVGLGFALVASAACQFSDVVSQAKAPPVARVERAAPVERKRVERVEVERDDDAGADADDTPERAPRPALRFGTHEEQLRRQRGEAG